MLGQEALRALGFYQSRLTRDKNILLTVRRCNVEYIPLPSWTTWLKYELVLISLRARGFFLSKRSIELDEKKTTDDLLVSIETEIACVAQWGRQSVCQKS